MRRIPARRSSLSHPDGQVTAFDELRDDETESVLGATHIEDRHDVGMVQIGEDAGLDEKCFHVLGLADSFRVRHLDGDGAVEVIVVSKIDPSEPALTEPADDPVAPDVRRQRRLPSGRRRRIFGSRCLDRAEELVLQEDFIVVIRCEARVVIQQAFDLDPKLGCAAAGDVKEGGTLVQGQLGCSCKDFLQAPLDLTHSSDFQTLAGRGFNDRSRCAAPSRSASQARANRQSRFKVVTDTPTTLAVSSTESPA